MVLMLGVDEEGGGRLRSLPAVQMTTVLMLMFMIPGLIRMSLGRFMEFGG
jgi:hypothetical protein